MLYNLLVGVYSLRNNMILLFSNYTMFKFFRQDDKIHVNKGTDKAQFSNSYVLSRPTYFWVSYMLPSPLENNSYPKLCSLQLSPHHTCVRVVNDYVARCRNKTTKTQIRKEVKAIEFLPECGINCE
jgi:hypothetical protein